MQIAGLGMAIDVADPVTGASIASAGEAGEMIVRKPLSLYAVLLLGR